MGRELKIRDLTLRDGQQSSFATRMTQEQIDRCLPFYKDANFFAMEVWGGAVPDSVMRYLGENPWDRLEKIHAVIGDVSKLTALSRGRNLFGYAPYTNEIIDGFCRNSIESGLGIMRIFDALNDIENVKSTVKYVKQYGGIADCAVCYTVDPKYPSVGILDWLKGKRKHKNIFTNEYFVNKAKQMEAIGADMITIKDMSGLIPPAKVRSLIEAFKRELTIPVDFHTHCTPGYGLASALAAIVAGVDVLDTCCWWFSGGTGAPAIEHIYVLAKKMGIELSVDMAAVAKINEQLLAIRKELELSVFGAEKPLPKSFNPLVDALPAEVDALFDKAIAAAQNKDDEALLKACHEINVYFEMPDPDVLVQRAEIPGGMYSNMVAQLKQLKAEDILPRAMELIPEVRLAAGLPPLVTPTSQIVGAQAVNCAIDEKAGRAMYTNKSSQFISLVKGEYGDTPDPIDPEFRLKICGTRDETPYDVSKYTMQPNPALEDAGGVLLAENEKEVLLLELFPSVAKGFLTKVKVDAYAAKNRAAEAAKRAEDDRIAAEKEAERKANEVPVTGFVVVAPLPGKIIELKVKVGDLVARDQEVLILEAMKMENSITTDCAGKVKRIFACEGENVATDAMLIEIEEA
ncbi:MAG: biotin/lipoyl-containing protein [Rikenellaceae bacterium]